MLAVGIKKGKEAKLLQSLLQMSDEAFVVGVSHEALMSSLELASRLECPAISLSQLAEVAHQKNDTLFVIA